ncbi:MAG: GxxExxY protein [Chloroflexi bacterium]|nr:GxxExxY protein [Chloroflexota bacterium]
MDHVEAVAHAVIGAGIRIHQRLGPGLLESVYEVILARDLARRGFRVERQKPVSFEFEGIQFEDAFRPDLIIDSVLVVKGKAVQSLHPVFERQLLTYLKILDLRLGLLMNSGMSTMKEGIHRVANC